MVTSNRSFFFFNDTATTEIYTLSLHDALPIFALGRLVPIQGLNDRVALVDHVEVGEGVYDVSLLQKEIPDRADRKSTRLNSSHANISYAVFCLKKKNKTGLTRIGYRHRRRPRG